MYHDFGFMGGSLGSAEGEKLARGFEFAMENNMPVVVVCRSGGARMQGSKDFYHLSWFQWQFFPFFASTSVVDLPTVFYRGYFIFDANGQGFCCC